MTTAAAALSMPTARERAMALDLLDAEPITRLTEDEPDTEALAALDREAEEFDGDDDFFWQRSVMNNG